MRDDWSDGDPKLTFESFASSPAAAVTTLSSAASDLRFFLSSLRAFLAALSPSTSISTASALTVPCSGGTGTGLMAPSAVVAPSSTARDFLFLSFFSFLGAGSDMALFDVVCRGRVKWMGELDAGRWTLVGEGADFFDPVWLPRVTSTLITPIPTLSCMPLTPHQHTAIMGSDKAGIQTTISPYTQQPVCTRPLLSDAELDTVLADAVKAQKAWKKVALDERIAIAEKWLVSRAKV